MFKRLICAAAVLSVCGLWIITAQPNPAGAVFTAGQAAAGRSAYQAQCASCHQDNLAGRNEAPQLAGSNFMNAWSGRTIHDLVAYIQASMPPGNGGSLGEATYVEIAAWVLQSNGARAGAQPLTAVSPA